jgi:tRNA pseudouridine55 synthase
VTRREEGTPSVPTTDTTDTGDGTDDRVSDERAETNGGRSGTEFGRGPPADRTPRQLLEFGVINLDKPPGPSAHQVSGWVRDLLAEAYGSLAASTSGENDRHDENDEDDGCDGGQEEAERGDTGEANPVDRAAHAGTLDPKVTGCLPVLTGTATRLSGVLLTPKEYVAVLEAHGRLPGDFEEVLGEFVGPIYQKPPRKSAVARRLRVREVYKLEVLDSESRRALLRISCASGTYVRKLCHDLGLALGTGAHMGDLRRTRAEPFSDADLVTLHDLADALAFATAGEFEALREVIEPAERALVHLPRLVIAYSAAREVANGAPVYAPGVLGYEPPERPPAEGVSGPDGSDASSTDGGDGNGETPLVACYTPDGAAVCLGRLVGDPDAERGTVLDTDRVLV